MRVKNFDGYQRTILRKNLIDKKKIIGIFFVNTPVLLSNLLNDSPQVQFHLFQHPYLHYESCPPNTYQAFMFSSNLYDLKQNKLRTSNRY